MANFSAKHAALSIGAAALLLLASVGISVAQSTPIPTPTSNSNSKARAVIDDAAAKLGLTGDQLAQALRDARRELGVGSAVSFSRAQAVAAAATALGLADTKALRQQLSGTTLTSVAQQKGIDPATVANAIKANLNGQVDAQVGSGKLSASRAVTLKQQLSARVDALMSRQFKAAKSHSG